jgi:hypothetical protein
MGRYRTFKPQHIMRFDGTIDHNSNFYEPDHLLSQQSPPMDQEMMIRETSWNYYRVLGFLPNPSELLQGVGKDISEFKYLLEDPFINGLMSSRKAGTLALTWNLDRGKCPEEYFKILQQIFSEWDIEAIIDELLLATYFGYVPAEVTWAKIKGNWLPANFQPKDPDWIRFSDTNEMRYLTKRNMVTGEPLPKYRVYVARYRAGNYERPYGRPLAATIYWPAKFVHTGFRFFTTFIEKYGMPWVNIKYPLGTQAQRLQQAIDMISGTTQDGVIATPDQFQTELLNLSDKASAENYKMFIDLNHEVMSISVLGQNLTTKVAGGSFAAAKIHGDVRQDIIMGDRHMAEKAFNTVIDWVFQLNWPTIPRPRFELIDTPKPQAQDGQMALYLAQTSQYGFFTTEYYKNRFNLLDEEINLANVVPLQSGAPGPGGNNSAIPKLPEALIKHKTEAAGPDDTDFDPDPEIVAMTHDVTDTARNEATYESTIDSVKNLTRR